MDFNSLNQISFFQNFSESEFNKKLNETIDNIKNVEYQLNKLSLDDKKEITTIVVQMNQRMQSIVDDSLKKMEILSDDTRKKLIPLVILVLEVNSKAENESVEIFKKMLLKVNRLASAPTAPRPRAQASDSTVLCAKPREADIQKIIKETPKYSEYKIKDVKFADMQDCICVTSDLSQINFGETCLEFTERALDIKANSRVLDGAKFLYISDPSVVNLLLNKIRQGSASEIFSIKAPDTFLSVYGRYQSYAGNAECTRVCSSGLAKGTDVYGNGEFKMSCEEVKRSFDSCQEFTSEKISLDFWYGLRNAMSEDNIYYLPGGYNDIKFLRDLKQWQNCHTFLTKVESEIKDGGWPELAYSNFLNIISLDQMASQIVHTQDLYLVCNGDGKIMPRDPGSTRPIRQVSMAGLQNINHPNTPRNFNSELIKSAFYTAMRPANKQIMVFPAIGMGYWSGPPELYWPCFLDAYLDSRIDMQALFVNPRHKISYSGDCHVDNIKCNFDGDEFQVYLDKKKGEFKNDPHKLEKLNRIHNLYEDCTDILQLAHNLAQKYKETTVFLANASDGNALMGKCIGGSCKDIAHHPTAQEHFALNLQPTSIGHKDIRGLWPCMSIKDLDKKAN